MGANPLTKWNTPEGEAVYPTVGSNGNRVAASLRQPTIARRKASELSSVERSALMDELVNQLIDVKRDIRDINAAWQQMQLQQNARLDAHANVLLRSRFWHRLRWLWSGA